MNIGVGGICCVGWSCNHIHEIGVGKMFHIFACEYVVIAADHAMFLVDEIV